MVLMLIQPLLVMVMVMVMVTMMTMTMMTTIKLVITLSACKSLNIIIILAKVSNNSYVDDNDDNNVEC